MITATVQQIASKWWTFLVRGLAGLALCAFAFAEPGSVATALVFVFGAYFIVSGIASVAAGVSFTGAGQWFALILLGVVQVFLGIVMLSQPGMGPLALAYLFGSWLLLTGVSEISSAVALRSVIQNEFWYVLLGVVTLAFGFYAVFNPALGVLALVYTVGWYGLLTGIASIVFAFRLKGLGDTVRTHATAS
jgi:uncharacterized membrane protein HdeD (DUF308 family)